MFNLVKRCDEFSCSEPGSAGPGYSRSAWQAGIAPVWNWLGEDQRASEELHPLLREHKALVSRMQSMASASPRRSMRIQGSTVQTARRAEQRTTFVVHEINKIRFRFSYRSNSRLQLLKSGVRESDYCGIFCTLVPVAGKDVDNDGQLPLQSARGSHQLRERSLTCPQLI